MKKLIYHIGRLKEDEQENLDFMDGLQRNIEERIELGFVFIKLPVINDAPYRVFNKIEDYRKWANENLPKWLGYNIVE